ncbi:MAG: SUMF1/EgtB/PvdO family nonheme iron enzyme [Spirochaetia bacterium]|nr:SUMF1/EgtB/PvdO family nonheme iron enzyme [Spirochaetia bacterium]
MLCAALSLLVLFGCAPDKPAEPPPAAAPQPEAPVVEEAPPQAETPPAAGYSGELSLALVTRAERAAETAEIPGAAEEAIPEVSDVSFAAFGPEGVYFLTVSGSDIRVWDSENGKQEYIFRGGKRNISCAALGPSALRFAFAADGKISIVSGETQRIVREIPAKGVAALRYTEDGAQIISVDSSGAITWWDAASGKRLRSAKAGISGFTKASISGDGKRVLYEKGGSLHLRDIASGKDLKSFPPAAGKKISRIDLSHDGSMAAVVFDDGQVSVMDTRDGTQVRAFEASTLPAAVSRDNTRVLIASGDGGARLHDLSTGGEIVRYAGFENGEWVSIVPEGYYNASVHGASLYSIKAGEDSYSLEQFAEALYRPDKVAAAVSAKASPAASAPPAGTDAPPSEEGTFGARGPLRRLLAADSTPPKVEILGPRRRSITSGETDVKVKITAQGGGTGVITVKSGRTLKGVYEIGEHLDRKYTENGKTCYDVSLRVPLNPGKNIIGVSAFNQNHTVESEKSKTEVTTSWAGAGQARPVLHVLTAAIKDYKDPQFNLDYTINDAQSLAEYFSRQATGSLYSEVKLRAIQDGQVTREGFNKAFDEIKASVSARDSFVFFFAGHGAVDDNGDFFFVPWDTTGLDGPAERNITRMDIVKNILKIPAQNSLILLDACQSGAILEMDTPFGRLLKDLDQKAIIAASLGNQGAAESAKFGHGMFTLSVLDGIDGKAGTSGERYVGVKQLIGFVRQDVPEKITGLRASAQKSREGLRALTRLTDTVQKPVGFPPEDDFSVIDLWLTPGELRVSSAADGRLLIVGSQEESRLMKPGDKYTASLPEGRYELTYTFSNTRVEKRTVDMVNTKNVNITFGGRRTDVADLAGFEYIDGGAFRMGSPASEAGRRDDETAHSVTLGPFYMGKFEVTQKEYQAIMGKNPSGFPGEKNPVESLTWFDAIAYCNARSQKEGLTPAYELRGRNVTWNRQSTGYRLPTEAEWEFACRTGHAGGAVSNIANVNTKATSAVGSFEANAWGLYDMIGNVWEWCWDWYGEYGEAALSNPGGPDAGPGRVVRGGGYYNEGELLRPARRGHDPPTRMVDNLGFRLVRSAAPAPAQRGRR